MVKEVPPRWLMKVRCYRPHYEGLEVSNLRKSNYNWLDKDTYYICWGSNHWKVPFRNVSKGKTDSWNREFLCSSWFASYCDGHFAWNVKWISKSHSLEWDTNFKPATPALSLPPPQAPPSTPTGLGWVVSEYAEGETEREEEEEERGPWLDSFGSSSSPPPPSPSQQQSQRVSGSSGGQIQLWQFLLDELRDPLSSRYICWTGHGAEFKLKDPNEVARRWGLRKNKPKMNYEKLSRGLRYYYDKKIIEKSAGKRYVYRFSPKIEELIKRTKFAGSSFYRNGGTGISKRIDKTPLWYPT